MATQFVPLELPGIEEGRFMEHVNSELRDLQQRLREYRAKYGEAAAKAKAKLTVEITLGCVADDEDMFSVKAQTKTSVPARPPSVTYATAGEDQTGQQRLFIRQSGSTADSPKQRVFSTEDGRNVDPDTGEVVTERADE